MKKLFMLGMCIGLASAQGGGVSVEFTPLTIPLAPEPFITAIQLEGTNILVSASVPPGFSSVTLESSRRLNGQGWTPQAVGRLNRSGGRLTFRLSQAFDLGLLRLRVDAEDPLPSFFFDGQTTFAGQPVNGMGAVALGPTDGVAVPGASPTGNDTSRTREVTESDIWKLDGDTLYFFNQYRGLQVVDVSHPDAPVVNGSLALSAAGEQMYLLDDTHVVLLARDGCDWISQSGSQVMVVEIKAGQPELIASLPVAGTIVESRLVGTALYVASGSYRLVVSTNTPNTAVWEWINEVASFDLSQPGHPVLRSKAEVPGSYGAVVTATDRFLFLAGEKLEERMGSSVPVIYVFDISAADGSFAQASQIRPFGRVKDKFKMNLVNDVFTAVSEDWNGTTVVETFSLADGSSPSKLGTLKLTQNETLYATQFASNLLYAVTFHRVDPLWIVDLSDPSHPKISGELQVPGFSTYLYPWGDRLVAVGRDSTVGSLTTVSLFDVHDATHPALLSRVTPGQYYSYSEANYDEKAFGVLADIGLILLPFSSYTGTNTIQGVQLIDLNHDSLVLRGLVRQDLVARRSTVHRGRVLSLSGRELLSVDATDRDHPVVRSSTVLSWPVDQVLLSGQFLIELDFGWSNGGVPQLRVGLAEDPDHVLNRLSLTNLPLLGAVLRDQRLYIAQGQSASVLAEWDSQHQTNVFITNAGIIRLTVLDVSRLPEVTQLGHTQDSTSESYASDWRALWPKPGLLVWQSMPGYILDWRWNWMPIDVAVPFGGGGVVRGGFAPGPWGPYGGDVFWPWWGWGSTRLIAFDVSEPTTPNLVSEVDLSQTNSWGGSVQEAFATDRLIYTSHREYESIITGTNYYVFTNTFVDVVPTVVRQTNVFLVQKYVTVTNEEIVTNFSTVVLSHSHDPSSWQWTRPAPLPGVVASGGAHSILLDHSGGAWTWGANEFGQAGDGSRSVNSPTIAAVPNFGGILCVAAGSFHNVVATTDGKVWAWGGGFSGQLGHGEPPTPPDQPPVPYDGSALPVDALGISNIVTVAAGAYHSLALSAEGKIWTWGANDSGQVGSPISHAEFVPKQVVGLGEAQAIAGGGSHSLALLRDGTVWTWGGNEFGQLGHSKLTFSTEPARVPGLSNLVAVAGGRWHSLALNADGTVRGWGRGDLGQLGQGAELTNLQPIAIPGLSAVQALSAGPFHNLALKSDGTVWTWGANDSGQLGRDPLLTGDVPGAVAGLSNAVAISAGDRFSLALTREGTLWGWGENTKGQLGDGLSSQISCREIRTNITTILTYVSVTNVIVQTNYENVTRTVVVTNEYPIITWLAHDFLDVVDYTVSTNPVVRPPANLPGSLQGISHHGALLYTVAERPKSNGGEFSRWIEASAYDGVQAHLVDSLILPNQWPQPTLVQDAVVYLGITPIDTNSLPELQAWEVATTGKLTHIGSLTLPSPAQELRAFGGVLAVRGSDAIQLVDCQTPTNLSIIGEGGPNGCVYYDVGRADGSLQGGLWLALGDYGVARIKLGPPGQK